MKIVMAAVVTGFAVCAGAFAEPQGAHESLLLDATQLNLGLFQDEPVLPEPSEIGDDWRVDFTAWIWLLGMEGDVGARGFVTDVDADFGDILDESDSIFALSGRLEIGKGRWGAFVDGMYADLGAEDQSGPAGIANVDIAFEQIILDFGLMFRVGEWAPEGDAGRNHHNTSLDLYAGGRWSSLDLTLNPALAATRSGDEDWIDPIIGARFVLPLAKNWHLAANGDIGGFGVSSDFTWSATLVFGYDFHLFDLPASVLFGYRAIGWDYTSGSGNERFTWDVVQHGPLLGLSLSF